MFTDDLDYGSVIHFDRGYPFYKTERGWITIDSDDYYSDQDILDFREAYQSEITVAREGVKSAPPIVGEPLYDYGDLPFGSIIEYPKKGLVFVKTPEDLWGGYNSLELRAKYGPGAILVRHSW